MNGDIRRYFIPIENVRSDNRRENIREINNTIQSNMPIEPLTTTNESDVATAVQQQKSENELQFEYIPGKRKNSKLVYLTEAKFIFTPINTNAKHGTRYSCITPNCPARITIRNNGFCEISKRGKPHIAHMDHLHEREEFIANNNIKNTCTNVDILCGGSGINVSVKSIFDNETIR